MRRVQQISETRAKANRQNASKSTGPRTAAGKTISRLNAATHGVLSIRSFLRLALDEAAPDHSTISRTRRLLDLETHRAVFTWVQVRLLEAGLLKGKTVAIDATTLEANAAMRSIANPVLMQLRSIDQQS